MLIIVISHKTSISTLNKSSRFPDIIDTIVAGSFEYYNNYQTFFFLIVTITNYKRSCPEYIILFTGYIICLLKMATTVVVNLTQNGCTSALLYLLCTRSGFVRSGVRDRGI